MSTQWQSTMNKKESVSTYLPRLKSQTVKYPGNTSHTQKNSIHQSQQNKSGLSHLSRSKSINGGESRMSSYKLQYLNKSPGYFRKKQYLAAIDSRNLKKYDRSDIDDRPVQNYLEEHLKLFEKKGLLDMIQTRNGKPAISSHKKFRTVLPHEEKALENSRLEQKFKTIDQISKKNDSRLTQMSRNSECLNSPYRFGVIKQEKNDSIEEQISYHMQKGSVDLNDIDYSGFNKVNRINLLQTKIKKKQKSSHSLVKAVS